MKILFVNKFLYPRGGAESYMLKLGEYYKQAGHEVQYFGMYDKKNTVGNKAGLYTKNMNFHSRSLECLIYPFKIIYSMEAYRKLCELISDWKPDIIHMNNINFQLTPSVIDAAYKMKVPVIQTIHDSQMVCPGHLLYRNGKQELCRLCVDGSKWNCMKNRCIHGSLAKSLIGSIEGYVYKYKKSYDKVALYICPSKFMEEIILSQKRFSGKTKVIHNFTEDVKKDFGKKEDYILFFGRLSIEKGLDIFLKVCKRFPEQKFKIAGDGPLANECKNLTNVQYLGMLTGECLQETIAKAKLVLYPSVCYENCPLSILEAISLGTPVISSSRGGSMELIEVGKTGELITEPITAEKFIDKIEELEKSPEVLDKMTEYCRASRSSIYSVESYGEQMINLYQKVIDEKEMK